MPYSPSFVKQQEKGCTQQPALSPLFIQKHQATGVISMPHRHASKYVPIGREGKNDSGD